MIAYSQVHYWLNKLVIPTQDLTNLSFCPGNREAHVNKWLQELPMTQAQQVSALFYRALPEIGRLKTSAETRLAILEAMRNPVFQCQEALAQRYLNQPLILPEAALKTATVAQAIQKHMNNAYLVAVRDLCSLADPKQELQAIRALAIHRALSGLGLQLLRNYQLYVPTSSQIWTEIHSLYRLAAELQLEQIAVEDTLPHHRAIKTIHLAYLRLLLLSSARPNQLRQEEVAQCYDALELLVGAAELDKFDAGGKENLYVVMTSGNRPPFYKSRLSLVEAKQQVNHLLELRTTGLIAKLQEFQATSAEEASEKNEQPTLQLSPSLIKHLGQAWSHLALRSFERQDVHSDIEITVGLTNIHFHLAGECPFNVFLNQTSTLEGEEKGAIFQKRGAQLKTVDLDKEDDPWGDAFDITGTIFDGVKHSTENIEAELIAKEKEQHAGKYPIFTVPLIDRSPGGFGLEWRDEIPGQVKAGELVGLRESGRNRWTLGVVRWVHQIKGATQLGIKVLAPQANPVGLAVVHKTGGFSEYLRGLQIPELKAINQPASLIANAISFHEYSKVRLYSKTQTGGQPGVQSENSSDNSNLQLTQRLFATGSFSQFAYRPMVSAKPQANDKEDFDSVWE